MKENFHQIKCIVLKQTISALTTSAALIIFFISIFAGTAKADTLISSPLTFETNSNGTAWISYCDTNYSGSLSIPAAIEYEGNIYSITAVGPEAFYECKSLTEVIIPDSITWIETYAFGGCSSLSALRVDANNPFYKDIEGVLFSKDRSLIHTYPIGKVNSSYTIPNGVAQIAYGAFAECNQLSELIFPESISTIGAYAFYFCTSLTEICIPKNVVEIELYAFYNCSSLNKIQVDTNNAAFKDIEGVLFNKEGNLLIQYPIGKTDISYTIPDGVTSIAECSFHSCPSLIEITLPDSIMAIGESAFDSCSLLNKIVIPDTVTVIGDYAFYNCYSLSGIWVDSNNSVYKDIEGVLYNKEGTLLIQYPIGKIDSSYTIPNGTVTIGDFSFCATALAEVIIPESVTEIKRSAFESCASLQEIIIPDHVVEIGDYAFFYCSSLNQVTLGNNLSSIGDYAFYVCNSLTEITIPDSVVEIGDYAFFYCTSLTQVTLGNNLSSIGACAFYNCTELTEISFPDNVSTIGESAFEFCPSLTTVHFSPNSNLSSIGAYAFYDCESLAGISIPDPVASIGEGAFYNCTSLSNVTFGNSLIAIGNYAFAGCTALTQALLPETINIIGEGAFYDCNSLSTATFGSSLVFIGEGAFAGCSSLKEAILPETVTKIGTGAFDSCSLLSHITLGNITKIEAYTFSYCRALTEIEIPNSVTSIEEGAFAGCGSLSEISISNSITNIGVGAFYACSILTSITLSSNLTEIGDYAFNSCYSLSKIYFRSTVPPTVGPLTFEYCPMNMIVYYPAGSEANWGTHWQDFTTQPWDYTPEPIEPSLSFGNITVDSVTGITAFTLTFTGTLQESSDGQSWNELSGISSPYTVTVQKNQNRFFRVEVK